MDHTMKISGWAMTDAAYLKRPYVVGSGEATEIWGFEPPRCSMATRDICTKPTRNFSVILSPEDTHSSLVAVTIRQNPPI